MPIGALTFPTHRHGSRSYPREIDRECRTVAQYSEIKGQLPDVYAELETRYGHHQRQLWWIGVLVPLSLAVTVGAFF